MSQTPRFRLPERPTEEQRNAALGCIAAYLIAVGAVTVLALLTMALAIGAAKMLAWFAEGL